MMLSWFQTVGLELSWEELGASPIAWVCISKSALVKHQQGGSAVRQCSWHDFSVGMVIILSQDSIKWSWQWQPDNSQANGEEVT